MITYIQHGVVNKVRTLQYMYFMNSELLVVCPSLDLEFRRRGHKPLKGPILVSAPPNGSIVKSGPWLVSKFMYSIASE